MNSKSLIINNLDVDIKAYSVFVKVIIKNMDRGLTTKMGADNLTENNPKTSEFICPICLPKPKSSRFHWKKTSMGIGSPSFCS